MRVCVRRVGRYVEGGVESSPCDPVVSRDVETKYTNVYIAVEKEHISVKSMVYHGIYFVFM